MKNLFVGNLSSNLTPDELRVLFQSYGAVERIEIVTDVKTRYSRGFAFIEMTNDTEALKAVSNLNGTTVWGNPLRVEEARPKPQRRNSAACEGGLESKGDQYGCRPEQHKSGTRHSDNSADPHL